MSEIQIDINEVMRNTRRYWYIDGIPEIAGGIIIIAIALSYMLIYQIENQMTKNLLLGFGQPALILLTSFFAGKLVTMCKQKITYPRTGLIKFRKGKTNKQIQRIFLVILIAAAVSAFVSFFASMISERFLPVLGSFFLGAYSWYLGYFNGVRRFYIVAGSIVIFGGIISWLNLGGGYPYIILLIGIGLIWIVAGGWTLASYLRQTQPISEEI
ncbi:MAG: hypothetical protein ACYDH1_15175 [Anaerolineaceae bacterium]